MSPPTKGYTALLLFAGCLASCADAPRGAPRICAGQSYIIRPGRESELRALVAPLQLGGEVNGGWILQGFSVARSRVEYRLARGEEEHRLVLQPPTWRGSTGKLGTSGSFILAWKAGGQDPDAGALAALRAVARRVQANDRGAFWKGCAAAGPVVSSPPWLLQLNRAILALALLLALLSVRPLWTASRELGGRYWLAMAGVLALALCLRALLPPHAPLHANTHGIRELREVLLGHDALIPNLLMGQYGLARHALLSALAPVFGGTAAGLIWANVVLGSLTASALGLATTALTGSRVAGVLAALLLACLPAHVRLSASESGLLAYNLFLALSLVAARLAVTTGQWRLYALASLLTAFTTQLHLVSLAAPAVLLAALLAQKTERSSGTVLLCWYFPGGVGIFFRKHRWKVLAAAAVVLTLAAPHAVAMVSDHWQAGQARGDLSGLGGWFSSANLLLNPRVTPILLPVAAACGVALVARGQPAMALVGLLGLAAISWLHLLVNAAFSDAVRYQTTTLMLITPAAAHGLAWLLQRARWPGLVTVAALLASAVPGLWLIAQPDNEALEQAFIGRSVARLPRQATLVLLDERLADRKLLTDFPDYLLLEHGRRWDVVRAGELRRRRVRGPLVYYQGLTCASFTDDERRRGAAGTVRRECERIRRRYRLRPITEGRLAARRLRWSSRPYYFHRIPGETIQLGFYYLDR